MAHVVMLDFDGTIAETNDVADRCYVASVAQVLGIDEVDTDWAGYRHVTDPGIVVELIERHSGRPARADEIDAVRDDYLMRLHRETESDPAWARPVPGAQAFLDALRARPGCLGAVATGAWGATIDLKLRAAGLELDGIALATADDAHAREEIMRIALDRALADAHAATFESVVYFGDGVWDLRAATRLGYGFVGVGREGEANRLREAGATHVIADYGDLDEVFSLFGDVSAAER